MIQKVLLLFRALPYASACGGGYSRERALEYPPPPTAAPARWQAEKEQNQKAAVGGKKKPNSGPIPTFPKGKEIDNHAIGHGDIDACKITTSAKCNGLLQITPTANRNSYRVAKVGVVDTQGSVLRPQPWAGKSQLLQSCQG